MGFVHIFMSNQQQKRYLDNHSLVCSIKQVEVPSLFYPGCGGTRLVLSSKWKYLACSIQAVGAPDWFYLASGST